MKSLILITASRFLLVLMLFFSIWVLLRGHNAPGGGFTGGLIAASAFSLYLIAYGVKRLKKLLVLDLPITLGLGLLCVVGSGMLSIRNNQPFLTASWFDFLSIKFGTPLIFDIGIYFVVVSSVLIIIYALEDETQ